MADEELVQCPPGYKLRITDENFQALEGLAKRKKTHIELVMNLMKMVGCIEKGMLLKSLALVFFHAVILGFINFILNERLASLEALVLAVLWFLLTALYTVDSAVRLRKCRCLFEYDYDRDKALIRQMNLIRREMMVEEEVRAGAGEETSLSEWSRFHLVECICKQIARPLTEYWVCSRVWLFYYRIALYGGFLCMHYPVRYILSY